MDKFVEDGTKFDFIFGDLTDVPLSLTPQKQNKEWQFLQSVLGKSLGLLKPNGKFLTHVILIFNLILSLSDETLHLFVFRELEQHRFNRLIC